MDLRVNSRRARLPPELLDLIIRENAADSPALQSCALVCSAFLTSSQACIFSLVLLKPQEGSTQRLYDILSRSPHLCAHVRTLHLIDLIEDCETWYPCAVALLYLLNSLKSVVLRGYAGVDWCNFPQELRGAICALCQRSALRALKVFQLGTFRDLAEFGQLVASPVLVDLNVGAIDLPVGAVLPDHHRGWVNLALGLLGPSTIDILTGWLVGRCHLSSLRALSSVWTTHTTSHLRKLLPLCTALHTISLYVASVQVHDLLTSVSLAHSQNLQVLTLSMGFLTDERFAETLFELAESCPRTLRRIKINLLAFRVPAHSTIMPSINWSRLDTALAVEKLPALTAQCRDLREG